MTLNSVPFHGKICRIEKNGTELEYNVDWFLNVALGMAAGGRMGQEWDEKYPGGTEWNGGFKGSFAPGNTEQKAFFDNIVTATPGIKLTDVKFNLDNATNYFEGNIYLRKLQTIVSKDSEVNFNIDFKGTGPLSLISACGGDIDAVIDSLEFDTSFADSVSICHVAGNIYAVAYQGPDLDGWLATVEIDTAGNIAATVEDTWEWDTTQADFVQIVKMQTGIFAIAYSDSGLDGWIFTFAIADDGTITKSKIASEEFNITLGYPGKILRINNNLAVLVYCGPGGDGWCETFTIDDAGAISQTDSLEFDGATGAEPWICHVSGEIYAVAYRGPGDDGWVKTFSIDSSGDISDATLDSLEFDTGTCYEPSICKATGNYFVVAYRGAGAAGKLHVIEIDTSGNITDPVKDSYTFQANNSYLPEVIELGGGYVAIAYYVVGVGTQPGYIKTILVDSAGDMGDTILDTLEFDADKGGMPRLCQLGSTCNYAIAFVGPDDDGWIKTFGMN